MTNLERVLRFVEHMWDDDLEKRSLPVVDGSIGDSGHGLIYLTVVCRRAEVRQEGD